MRQAIPIVCVITISATMCAGADTQFDAVSALGMFSPKLPTSFAPDADEIVDECVRRLARQVSEPERIRLLCLKSEAHLVLRQWPLALETSSLAKQLVPNNPRILMTYAKASANAGNIDEAFQVCDAVLENDPKNVTALTLRALLTCQARNEPEDAIDDATTAIRIDTSDARGYFVRSLAGAKHKSYGMALQDIDTYLSLVSAGPPPRKAAPFVLKGQILMSLNQLEAAVRTLDLALQIDPDSFAAAENLWRCYRKLEHKTFSIMAAEKMLAIDAEGRKSHRAMSISYFDAKKYSKALEHLERWQTAAPRDSYAAALIAAANFHLGDYKAAKRGYDESIRANPGSNATRLARAVLLAQCPDVGVRNPKQALVDVAYVTASKQPLSDRMYRLISIIQYTAGEPQNAIATLESIMAKQPPLGEEQAAVFRRLATAMQSGEELQVSFPSLYRLAADSNIELQ